MENDLLLDKPTELATWAVWHKRMRIGREGGNFFRSILIKLMYNFSQKMVERYKNNKNLGE